MQRPPKINACTYDIMKCSGILTRAVEFILAEYERKFYSETKEVKIPSSLELSAYEIYNEKIYDLPLE